ncbi:MAG: hypothetical protein ACRD4R_12505 [Candidatus Acidiferrales bacterium]
MNSFTCGSPKHLQTEQLEIEPVTEENLPRVAEYLTRWHSSETQNDEKRSVDIPDSKKVEKQLSWRLLQNPARRDEAELGYCVRSENGEIVGTILVFPSYFMLGDRRLTGLCSSCFFVNPEARFQALLIFKKYLRAPHNDFYFGTTCSLYSGKLWQKLRGWAVPDSQFEYIVPFQTSTLLEALADSKRLHRNWAMLARIIGRGTDTLRTVLINTASRLKVERTQDWDRIAELSRRHRNANLLTNERSSKFIEWRYAHSAGTCAHKVFCFIDKAGNEGWFALGQVSRGQRGQVRGTVVLDFVWPQQKIKLSDVLSAAVELSAPDSDAMFLGARPGLRYGVFGQMMVRRKLEGPQCFVLTSKATDTIPSNIVEFVPADGDSAD